MSRLIGGSSKSPTIVQSKEPEKVTQDAVTAGERLRKQLARRRRATLQSNIAGEPDTRKPILGPG